MAEMIAEDQGRILVPVIAAPGGGTEFLITLPLRTRWRVMSVIARFTTSVDVVDRHAILRIGLGADAYVTCPTGAAMVASQIYTVCWFAGAYIPPVTGGLYLMGNLPEKLLLNDQMWITSETTGMVIGDQWNNIFALVEEWIEPLV